MSSHFRAQCILHLELKYIVSLVVLHYLQLADPMVFFASGQVALPGRVPVLGSNQGGHSR